MLPRGFCTLVPSLTTMIFKVHSNLAFIQSLNYEEGLKIALLLIIIIIIIIMLIIIIIAIIIRPK